MLVLVLLLLLVLPHPLHVFPADPVLPGFLVVVVSSSGLTLDCLIASICLPIVPGRLRLVSPVRRRLERVLRTFALLRLALLGRASRPALCRSPRFGALGGRANAGIPTLEWPLEIILRARSDDPRRVVGSRLARVDTRWAMVRLLLVFPLLILLLQSLVLLSISMRSAS